MTTIEADPATVAEYTAEGWWGSDTPTDLIWRHAASQPEGVAYIGGDDRMTWAVYDELSDRIAAALLSTGIDRGDRVAVFLPDGPHVHAAFVGADKAGVAVMGIGQRAGEAEVDHLVGKSGARAIITMATTHRGAPTSQLVDGLRPAHARLAHHIVLDGPTRTTTITIDGEPAPEPDDATAEAIASRRMGPNELCLLNSTSGTTGLPKCVMMTHNRWFFFHQKAAEFGALTDDEVFCVPVPAPFGFGLWTSHYTPAVLGVPTVVMADFDADEMIRAIERERVTVLCAVTTQFIMMLNSPILDDHDLSSLRIMFTGGEAIPYQRAAEFEDRTGCTVLNFYGSNETGMLSGTRVTDSASTG